MGVTAENISDVQRSAGGYTGFWLAMSGAICLVCWWILFTIWFCNKKVGVTDFSGGDDYAGRRESDRTIRQKQPIANESDDDDEDEENSRMELAPRNNT